MSDRRPLFLERFDEFPSYKGGHTCLYGGYVWEFLPGHHLQNQWGWVAQHRIVAEDKIGRPLRRSRDPKIGEHVHHIDGCPTNNDPANLEVLTKSQHHSLETSRYFDRVYGHVTHEAALIALEGRTIREAAKFLGVTHMTLRKRCPEAVRPRKRSSPRDQNDASLLAEIRMYAASDKHSVHDAAFALKMAERTILKMCREHEIQWTRKSKKGMLHRTYRGKPTPRALALRASGIDPESTRIRTRQQQKDAQPDPIVAE